MAIFSGFWYEIGFKTLGIKVIGDNLEGPKAFSSQHLAMCQPLAMLVWTTEMFLEPLYNCMGM